jgi:di/tripeptidase
MKKRLCLSVILFFLLSISPLTLGFGGTNGLLSRMENMVNTLENNHTFTSKQATVWRDRIKSLREKVNQRIRENGGGINTTRDKDLYDEIDATNQPLYQLYQKSQNPNERDSTNRYQTGEDNN